MLTEAKKIRSNGVVAQKLLEATKSANQMFP